MSAAVVVVAGLFVTAAQGSAVQRPPKAREMSCWKVRYSKCDGVATSTDLVFVFPRARFKGDPKKSVRTLQAGYDFLRRVTLIDPVRIFGQRIVIGFRHPSDEGGKDCNPGFSKEDGTQFGFRGEQWPFINIPWAYLNSRDQPEECCSHELVHPFIDVRPLRDNRKEWIEGMCDFLRLPVMGVFGMPDVRDQRYELYRATAWKPRSDYYHDYAGRLITWCTTKGVDVRKPRDLPKIVAALWDMDLTAALGQRPR